MVLHGVLGNDELGRDLAVRQALGHEPQHFELALGEAGHDALLLLDPARERVELGEQLRGHRGCDEAVPAVHSTHCFPHVFD